MKWPLLVYEILVISHSFTGEHLLNAWQQYTVEDTGMSNAETRRRREQTEMEQSPKWKDDQEYPF